MLEVNSVEAETVRSIFRRYIEVGSVNVLREVLKVEGVVSKAWTTRAGENRGGLPIGTGALFHLLRNRVYRGEVGHKGSFYPAEHPAIVDETLFEAVQQKLRSHTVQRREKVARGPTGVAAFRGLIFDDEGSPMTPSLARGQQGRRYGYYVSLPRQRGQAVGEGVVARVSAVEIERLILERLRRLHDKPAAPLSAFLPLITRIDVLPQAVRVMLAKDGLVGDGDRRGQISLLQAKLDPLDRLSLARGDLVLQIGVRPVFRGGRTWMVKPTGVAGVGTVDRALARALLHAHEGLTSQSAAPTQGLSAWRQANAIPRSYLKQLYPIAFLAPDLQRAILEGRQPAGMTAAQLMQADIPLAWADQRKLFGL